MVGEDDALCLDRGFVGIGIGYCFHNAKIEVLRNIIMTDHFLGNRYQKYAPSVIRRGRSFAVACLQHGDVRLKNMNEVGLGLCSVASETYSSQLSIYCNSLRCQTQPANANHQVPTFT